MSGFKSKEANKVEKDEMEDEITSQNFDKGDNLSDELNKLNDLKQKGIISAEEFDKAKKKLLDN